ncbi:MFS transporter [Nonomuraea phyllanthi]|uniref:MFS transporter n=1 Tax=Nonomuraea phyllanthi TaxID=2219224 RepID=UPI0012930C31|nr:MFS transporter [Nonomuraea phyllanthi]QFY07186.1 MFS transporter [Nonomuraea phyllanthi]
MTASTAPTATAPRSPSELRRAAVMAVLTACVFVVGTAEWVMVGLLPELAADLHRPLPVTGSLVTWYALVVTVAGPLVTVGMLRLARRRALQVLLGVFVAGNLAAAVAGSFNTLVAARILTALTHSTAFAVTVVIAVAMTPATHRGRAIAAVTAGWNLATVLGAPLGTWLGHQFGWRTTFWAITALAALVLCAVTALVRPPTPHEAARPSGEVRAMLRPRAALVLAIIVVAQAGLFTTYTYIAPLLRQVSGFTDSAVTLLLALFGLGAVGGNILGGRLADRAPWAGLCTVLTALAGVLAAFTLTSEVRWAAATTVLTLGVIAAALIPLLQDRALAASPEAPTLVTAISASAFNLGVAGGSQLGGQALTTGLTLHDLPWTGALVAGGAVLLAAAAARRSPTTTVTMW